MSVEPYIYVRGTSWPEVMDSVTVEDITGDQIKKLFKYEKEAIMGEEVVIFPLEYSDLVIPIMKAMNRKDKKISVFVVFLLEDKTDFARIEQDDERTVKFYMRDNPQNFEPVVVEHLAEFGHGVFGVNTIYSSYSIIPAIMWLERMYNFILSNKKLPEF